MNNTLKKVIFISAILVFIPFLAFSIYGIKMNIETSKMTPLSTQWFNPERSGNQLRIAAIRDDYVNFYIIAAKDEFIAIDAGINAKNIEKELQKLNINPNQIKTVLLTHSDADHTAGLRLFKNAKIFLSDEEEGLINGKIRRSPLGGNQIKHPYLLLANGQMLQFGEHTIQCILTPGHTPGSMSYLLDQENLFTGDTLSLLQGKVELFNEFFNMDSKTERQTIQKIARFSRVKKLFTGHYGLTNQVQTAFTGW